MIKNIVYKVSKCGIDARLLAANQGSKPQAPVALVRLALASRQFRTYSDRDTGHVRFNITFHLQIYLALHVTSKQPKQTNDRISIAPNIADPI